MKKYYTKNGMLINCGCNFVSTVQSFLFRNKYKRIFAPTDFDLVISDEAHRSIGGNLVNPIVADARTEITTQLLSDEGCRVITTNKEGKDEEKFHYFAGYGK